MAALERKVRERNGCYLPGFSNDGHSYSVDNRGVIDVRQPISTSARNGGVLDSGPNISSPEESEDEELNRTIKRQEVVEQDVMDQNDGGKTADIKERGLKPKSGDNKKKRRSQLELLGVSSNQVFNGLGLRSGRSRAGTETLLSEEDEIENDENEDGILEDADESEF